MRQIISILIFTVCAWVAQGQSVVITGDGGSGPCTPGYWASGDTTFMRHSNCSVDTVIIASTMPSDTIFADSVNQQLVFVPDGNIDDADTVRMFDYVPGIVSISGQAAPTLNLRSARVFKVDFTGQTDLSVSFSNLIPGKDYILQFRNNLDSVALPSNAIFTTETGKECVINPITTKNFELRGWTDASTFWIDYSTTPVTCFTFDPSYDSVLVYAVANGIPLPSFPRQLKQSNYIKGAKTDNYWWKQRVYYDFYNDAATSAFARINQRNPYGSDNITEVGGMTWVANEGYHSDGTTGYLSTNWNPSTEGGGIFTQNSASIFYDVQSPSAGGSKFPFGIGNLRFEATWKYLVNNISDQVTGAANTAGVRYINRSGASANQAYQNGTSVHTGTATSTAVTSAIMSIFTFNSNTAFIVPTTEKIRGFGAGASMSATDVSNFQTRWTAHF